MVWRKMGLYKLVQTSQGDWLHDKSQMHLQVYNCFAFDIHCTKCPWKENPGSQKKRLLMVSLLRTLWYIQIA